MKKMIITILFLSVVSIGSAAEDISIEALSFASPLPLISQTENVLVFSIKNSSSQPVNYTVLMLTLEEKDTRLNTYRKLYKEYTFASIKPGETLPEKFIYTSQVLTRTEGKVVLKIKNHPETERILSFQIIPAKLPDFSLDRIEIIPEKKYYEPGEKIAIRPVWSASEGNFSAFSMKFYVDNREIQEERFWVYLPIKENGETSFDYIFTQPGKHAVKVLLNKDTLENEEDGKNNEKEIALMVKVILPDLVVEKLALSEIPVRGGERNKIKYTVKNIGLGASGLCLLEFIILEDNKEVSRLYEDIPVLASQESYSHEVAYTFSATTATRARVVASVDSSKLLKELSKTNNDKFIRAIIEKSVCSTSASMNEEEKEKNTKEILAMLEVLKAAEKAEDIDGYMVLYSTECMVMEPTIKNLDYETYKYRISDLFRQYDDFQRTYIKIDPVSFLADDRAVLTFSFTLEGIFREQKIKETISESSMRWTLHKESGNWKIIQQETIQ